MMVNRIKILARLILVILALGPGNVALADEAPGWDWRLSPLYYWSINIKLNENYSGGGGEPPTDPPPVHFSFEGAFSANFEGVYDNRLGFIFDVVGARLANTGENFKLDFDYLQTEIDGYYRFPFATQSVDLLAGARYYAADSKLEPTSLEADVSWVDPLAGLRWNWDISDTWSTSLRGDIGGFGVGSDLSGQAFALVDWHPWQHVSITGGLRALRVKYETDKGADNYELDMTFWGPLLGVSFRW
jgi:hypothetical protein